MSKLETMTMEQMVLFQCLVVDFCAVKVKKTTNYLDICRSHT